MLYFFKFVNFDNVFVPLYNAIKFDYTYCAHEFIPNIDLINGSLSYGYVSVVYGYIIILTRIFLQFSHAQTKHKHSRFGNVCESDFSDTSYNFPPYVRTKNSEFYLT